MVSGNLLSRKHPRRVHVILSDPERLNRANIHGSGASLFYTLHINPYTSHTGVYSNRETDTGRRTPTPWVWFGKQTSLASQGRDFRDLPALIVSESSTFFRKDTLSDFEQVLDSVWWSPASQLDRS